MASSATYIAHLDMDSFFVEVELLKAPHLRGKEVIVGGHLERGIVTTCSYEARNYGVHSAMPLKTAVRLCPHAIIIPGNFSEYSAFSRRVADIIARRAPVYEKASIDEFYIDLSGMDVYFDPLEWMVALREEIMKETGLPLSFGVGSTKMIAKMATNEAKPKGYLQVPPGSETAFLAPLAVSKIPGVGPQMKATLEYHGYRFIRDIQQENKEQFEKKLGNTGVDLWQKAFGGYVSAVNPVREQKSISKEHTFEQDTADTEVLLREIVWMCEQLAYELRKSELAAGCLAIKIKYGDFKVNTKQFTITPTSSEDDLIPAAKEVFNQLYRPRNPVRLIGVRVSNLTGGSIQTNLFQNSGGKSKLYKAIDDVKTKFGHHAVFRASGK